MNKIKKIARKRQYHQFLEELERRRAAKLKLGSLYGKAATSDLDKEALSSMFKA